MSPELAPWLVLFRDVCRGRKILYFGPGGSGVWTRLFELSGAETWVVSTHGRPLPPFLRPASIDSIPTRAFDVVLVSGSVPASVLASLREARSEDGFEACWVDGNAPTTGFDRTIRAAPFVAAAFVAEDVESRSVLQGASDDASADSARSRVNESAPIRLDASLAGAPPAASFRLLLSGRIPHELAERALVELPADTLVARSELVQAIGAQRAQEARIVELLERLRPLRRRIEARLEEPERPRLPEGPQAGTIIALETTRRELEARLEELEEELEVERRRRREVEERAGETLRPRIAPDLERKLREKDAELLEKSSRIAYLEATLLERKAREEAPSELEGLQRRIRWLEQSVKEREERVFELERERESQIALQRSAGTEQRDLSTKIRDLKGRLDGLALERAAEVADLTARIEELSSNLLEAHLEVESHEAAARSLGDRLSSERARASEAESQIDEARIELDRERHRAEMLRRELDAERDSARKARAELDATLGSRSEEEARARALIDHLTRETTAQRERLGALGRERETLTRASVALVADRDALLGVVAEAMEGALTSEQIELRLHESRERVSGLVAAVELLGLSRGRGQDEVGSAFDLRLSGTLPPEAHRFETQTREIAVWAKRLDTLNDQLLELDGKLNSAQCLLAETSKRPMDEATKPPTAPDERSELERLRARIKDLTDSAHARDLELATLHSERAKLEAARAEHQGGLAAAEAELAALRSEVTRLGFQSNMRERALKTAVADVRRLRMRTETLEKEIERRGSAPSAEAVEAKLRELRDAKDRAEQALSATLRHTAEMAEKSQRAIAGLERAAEWSAELVRILESGSELDSELTEMRRNVARLASEVKQLNAAKSPLKDVALAEHAGADKLLALAALFRAPSPASSVNDEKLRQAEAALAAGREERLLLRSRLDEALHAARVLRERNRELQGALEGSRTDGPPNADVDALRELTAENERLIAELADTKRVLASSEQALMGLRDETRVAVAALEEAHRQRDELARRLVTGAGLERPIAELAGHALELEAAVQERDAALKTVGERYRELARRLIEASARIERLERAASAAQAYKRQLDAERVMRAALEERLREMADHLDQSERRAVDLARMSDRASADPADETDARLREIEARLRAVEDLALHFR
ncbi:MAG: hypothetical protein HYV07_27455 [Deltaproteobacteria bacterium]|nr:hypothetical protein [Deltaproteobacteria bacterium]